MTAYGDDDGSALVEFTYLAVLLMVPLVYLLLLVLQVQSASFAVTEAARQAGRAYTRADVVSDGHVRAEAAVRLALADQGIDSDVRPTFSCDRGCTLSPGEQVTVRVSYRVPLPVLGGLFGDTVPPGIPVTATHVAVVDRFSGRASS